VVNKFFFFFFSMHPHFPHFSNSKQVSFSQQSLNSASSVSERRKNVDKLSQSRGPASGDIDALSEPGL